MDPGSGGSFLSSYSPEHSVFANLRKNDEDFTNLQLWLNATSEVPELIDAIWQNTSVHEVCLLVHESFIDQLEHEVLLLFTILGRLPQLTRLYFNLYRFPLNCTLPVRAFTNVFRSTRRLVEFKLWRTELRLSYYQYPDEEDEQSNRYKNRHSIRQQIQDWATALASSRCLKEFRLIKCRLTDDVLLENDVDTSLLDPLLEALAQIQTLKDVELSAEKASALGSLSDQSLKKLLLSKSLESLSLCNLDVSEEAVVAIAQGLNHSPVKHLRLVGVGTVASLFPKSVRDSFRDVLQSNYRLETLHLFDARNLQQEISFYLKLNRFGRSRLMLEHHGSKREWVDTLSQVADDLDCLFYFLGIQPLLCYETAMNGMRTERESLKSKQQ